MRSSLLILAASTMLAGGVYAAAPAKRAGAVEKAAVGPVAPPQAGRPQIGTFGFDEAGMDRSVPPGRSFYDFANGTWAKTTPIPADRSNYGMFNVLEDLSNDRMRGIIETAAKAPGSKIGDLYASFMDEAAVEAKGVAPVKPQLAAIAAVSSRAAFAKQLGQSLRDGVSGPIGAGVSIDDKDPDKPVVQIAQSGLGLPDRDYYLKADPKLAEAKAAYVAYLAKLFTLAGEPNGMARAQAIVAFEGRIAGVQWTRTESRDSDKTYNPFTRADLDKKAPGFDWAGFLGAAGLEKQPLYIVAQPTAIAGAAKVMAETPLPVLKDYLWARTLDDAAPWLAKSFVDAHFAFHGTVLDGTPENRPRWKRGVALVKNAMGEAVGEQYVARYFPPEAKAEADKLVKNIIAAMDDRLANLTWMAPETKVKARAKLAAFRPQIGYPTKWRDYSALPIARGDLYANVQAATRFEWNRGLGKLGKPADRDEWFMTPMEINAYANPVWNEIVFPAAILQPPFFDPKADPAVNYGGIGAVIGHEISHHFDDQGRKYDATGRLAEWWTKEDVARFTALTDSLVKQYDAYEPLPGLHVQGGLTLGENIADLAGLTVAHEAYRLSLAGKPAPVIDGFSGDQRFYLGWAQVWRRSYREANLRQRLLTDPHSPSEQRTAVVRNLDPWYDAYKPAPGSLLFLPPAQRVRIW
ncbi:M13 family metallopeptidase [Sphingomonas solaris]|uniref:M13 family metallopeptidase n=1 Tax=Alterirhizorhabdus solaris TaxID=2529389 RepID=A0A558QTX9_9SPHN|nr:M13 family metallopeptidase [Sphingomonas solaris]TVV70593.1 M13 family metallopeptidase [Sphingomonas solaris]